MLGIPFWLTDLVLADRFDVGVGSGGEGLGGPEAVARYLWRSAGDATAGWWPITLAVVAAAVAGVVLLRRRRALVLCLLGVTVAAFALARLGGSAAPESRHLIFLAPLLAIAVAATLVRLGRRSPAVAAVLVALLVVLEVAWAWRRTPPLFEWEPEARQAARADAEAWLAATSEPDDVLFGYEPLYLGAWERSRSFPTTVVPRADFVLALRTVERAGQLGRGVWVLDASERTTCARASRSSADCRPRRGIRGPCVRAVPRPSDDEPAITPEAFPTTRACAPRRPAARHRRRGRQPPHGRARGARAARLRPLAAFPLSNSR